MNLQWLMNFYKLSNFINEVQSWGAYFYTSMVDANGV